MKFFLFFSIISIIISCKSQPLNGGLKITPLTVMNETDTFVDKNRTSINLIENFLVEGNTSDTNKIYKIIDAFVEKNKNDQFTTFSVYYMEFYKASSQITVEAINRNPELIRKSLLADPRLATYYWFNGEFGGKTTY